MNAPCIANTSLEVSRDHQRQAWTAFWQEGQTQCVSAAPEIGQELRQHWTAFSATLAPGARVLDLGCGAGAVTRALTAVRRDVHVTGVDFATLPFAINRHFDLLSDTAMESMPFADGSFAAAVSQFGYEYSQTEQAARETARVLAPGAHISFIAHHAGSAILAENRERLAALRALLDSGAGPAFCDGDAPALTHELMTLHAPHHSNDVIAQLAHSLPQRITRADRERFAIWKAVEDALAPELWMLEALCAACVAPNDIETWLRALQHHFAIEAAAVLREPNGAPIAWRITGTRE